MRRAAAFVLIATLPLAAAQADVYRSVDAQGQVHYSDTPTPGAQLIRMQNLPSAGVPAPSSSLSRPATAANASTSNAPAPGADAPPRPTDPARAQMVQQAAQQALDKDLAATRAEQCKTATDNYNSSVQARRIYKTGANGEREYLTDAEADEQRLNLRMAMDNACGTTTPP